ncbi:hypothetical protein Esti_002497 [Eimeria stiedai]
MSSDTLALSSPATADASAAELEAAHTLNKQQQQQQQQRRAVLRCGDVWQGLYRPTIYPGRGRFTEGDIRDICNGFLLLICSRITAAAAPAAAAAGGNSRGIQQEQQKQHLGQHSGASLQASAAAAAGPPQESQPHQQQQQQQLPCHQQQQQVSLLPAEGCLELFMAVAVRRSACCLSKPLPLENAEDVFAFLSTVWETLFLEERPFATGQEADEAQKTPEETPEETQGLSAAALGFTCSIRALDLEGMNTAAAAAAAAAAAGLSRDDLVLVQRAALVFLILWVYYSQPLPSSSSSSSSSSEPLLAPLPHPIRLAVGTGRLLLSESRRCVSLGCLLDLPRAVKFLHACGAFNFWLLRNRPPLDFHIDRNGLPLDVARRLLIHAELYVRPLSSSSSEAAKVISQEIHRPLDSLLRSLERSEVSVHRSGAAAALQAGVEQIDELLKVGGQRRQIEEAETDRKTL